MLDHNKLQVSPCALDIQSYIVQNLKEEVQSCGPYARISMVLERIVREYRSSWLDMGCPLPYVDVSPSSANYLIVWTPQPYRSDFLKVFPYGDCFHVFWWAQGKQFGTECSSDELDRCVREVLFTVHDSNPILAVLRQQG